MVSQTRRRSGTFLSRTAASLGTTVLSRSVQAERHIFCRRSFLLWKHKRDISSEKMTSSSFIS